MTGHYLSPGGGEEFGGRINWFLGEQKEGSVVTEKPKGGITENFGRTQRGDHSSLLGKSRHWGGGGGGERESHQILLEGSLQWSNTQRGDRLNFTLFNLKSFPPLRRKIMNGPLAVQSALPSILSVILYCWSWSTTRSGSPSLLFV